MQKVAKTLLNFGLFLYWPVDVGRGRGKQGACRNGQGFRFSNAGHLSHVQITN